MACTNNFETCNVLRNCPVEGAATITLTFSAYMN
jgi:hypothetical protein